MQESKIVLLNTTFSFHCDLYILHANYMAHKSTTIVLTNDQLTVSLCLPLPRQSTLLMGPRWVMAPSTSSTGWTGASWRWGWSISCLPVCPLSTCTTTQNLPHCLWAPTLLSGWSLELTPAPSTLFCSFESLVVNICMPALPLFFAANESVIIQYLEMKRVVIC